MSESNRRHPNIVNLSEIDPTDRMFGTRMGGRHRGLGEAAGAKMLGCTWFELPPGRSTMPRHYHCANEEAVYVLEGEGTVRLGGTTTAIRAGDWITFPVGPEHAHQISNGSDAPLRYLAFSTKVQVDVVGYPDSQKTMAFAAKPGAKWTEPQWVRKIFEDGTQVEYFKGEKID